MSLHIRYPKRKSGKTSEEFIHVVEIMGMESNANQGSTSKLCEKIAATYVGGLFGALAFLFIAVNVTLYLHKRAWGKRKLDQAWVTLSNCLCRAREGWRRLVNHMPNFSTTGAHRRTTLFSVPRRPRDDNSQNYVNLLPTVHPINNVHASSDRRTNEGVQTRGFDGRRRADEPIYCLSTLDVTPSLDTSSPTNTEGRWPGRECSKTKRENLNLNLANQPLEGGLVSKYRREFQVLVPHNHKRLKTKEKISACFQPGDPRKEMGMALGGKASKSVVTSDSLTEARRKSETNKLKSFVEGREKTGSNKIQFKLPSPISFPGAKTGLYAVRDVESLQNRF